MNALNSGNALKDLQLLYANNAVLVTAKATIKGWNLISGYFTDLLTRIKGAQFTLTGNKNNANSCTFSWKASSTIGKSMMVLTQLGFAMAGSSTIIHHILSSKIRFTFPDCRWELSLAGLKVGMDVSLSGSKPLGLAQFRCQLLE